MAAVPSTMLPLGVPAPNFSLPDAVSGNTVSLDDFPDAKAFLIMFICNHCPYVRWVRDELGILGREYKSRGVAVIAINSNDADQYPDDSPAKMKEEATEAAYTFPYLYDETQAVAKAYRAACTPDFYIFDAARRLVYRGQLDDSRPTRPGKPNAGPEIPVTGKDVRAALEALLAGNPVPAEQKPSLGCNIKWKPGNAPEYFTSA